MTAVQRVRDNQPFGFTDQHLAGEAQGIVSASPKVNECVSLSRSAVPPAEWLLAAQLC